MPTIKENLEQLIKFVEEEPEQLFDLRLYETPTPCGTLHCALGLAATKPFFQGQGLRFLGGLLIIADGRWPNNHTLAPLFGEDSWSRLFEVRGLDYKVEGEVVIDSVFDGGSWDAGIFAKLGPGITDKELALARLNRQLALYQE